MAFSARHTDHAADAPAGDCCPRTGKPPTGKGRRPWLLWLLPVTGLLALLWFLIRVVPKPSRALYPCQRIAMPLASGFVVWLLGFGASVAAFHKARANLTRRRYAVALLAFVVSIGAIWAALSVTGESPALAEPDPLRPIGEAKGIHPGRVVWVHDPDATDWDGPGDGHLWEPEHTDKEVCDRMMSKAVRTLAGAPTDAVAWQKLFRHHNKARGKGDVPYQAGERITIKVNFVGFIRTHGGVKPETYELESWRDYMNTSPQMIAALLRQLTDVVGAKQAHIGVGDSLAYFAGEYYDMLHDQFPKVQYLDCQGKAGRGKWGLSSTPLHWSCDTTGCEPDRVPSEFTEAEYIINLANLKAHPGS
ncbi:MAG: hypothetical protein ACYTAS_12545, partial [Planctomycetota bacterium]